MDWDEANTERRGGYLGKLELLQRLQQELDGERETAVREAAKLGATPTDIAAASGLSHATIRKLRRR